MTAKSKKLSEISEETSNNKYTENCIDKLLGSLDYFSNDDDGIITNGDQATEKFIKKEKEFILRTICRIPNSLRLQKKKTLEEKVPEWLKENLEKGRSNEYLIKTTIPNFKLQILKYENLQKEFDEMFKNISGKSIDDYGDRTNADSPEKNKSDTEKALAEIQALANK